ncbi:tyrosine-type recombinase/integrase [Psychroserpens sp.]
MKGYRLYLEKNRYAKTTVKRRSLSIKAFIKWCKINHIKVEEFNYQNLLNYIKEQKKRHQKPNSIDRKLQAIRTYYDYLVEAEKCLENPAKDLRIQLDRRKLPINLLSEDELEDLYYSYETGTGQDDYIRATQIRNKIITGLIVYQGLSTTTLARLELEHLQLSKGKIYIPRTRRSNKRTLDLKPWQVMELLNYKEELQPILTTRTKDHYEKLFPVSKFTAVTDIVMKTLKRYNQKVTNVNYIRASVISNWLKQYDIRKTQYMVGHKRILSTEFYRQDNLESLQKAIANFHPLS